MTPEQEMMLKETHERTRSIEQLLKGYNGTEGMCADFEAHKREDMTFREKFYSFRLTTIIVLVVLAGGSGYSLAEILKVLR